MNDNTLLWLVGGGVVAFIAYEWWQGQAAVSAIAAPSTPAQSTQAPVQSTPIVINSGGATPLPYGGSFIPPVVPGAPTYSFNALPPMPAPLANAQWEYVNGQWTSIPFSALSPNSPMPTTSPGTGKLWAWNPITLQWQVDVDVCQTEGICAQ